MVIKDILDKYSGKDKENLDIILNSLKEGHNWDTDICALGKILGIDFNLVGPMFALNNGKWFRGHCPIVGVPLWSVNVIYVFTLGDIKIYQKTYGGRIIPMFPLI